MWPLRLVVTVEEAAHVQRTAPLVSFRCSVAGCGRLVAAMHTSPEDGRPLLSQHFKILLGHLRTEDGNAPTERWMIHTDLRDVSIGCRRHGWWIVSQSQLVSLWQNARTTAPLTVRLNAEDRDSPGLA